MDKNYQIVFPEMNKVELIEVPFPEIKEGQILTKTIVSQISTGTELTMLQGNVDKDSTWQNDLVYPMYPGYSNVCEVIDIGEDVPEDWLGKKVLSICPHARYVAGNLSDGYFPISDGVNYDEAVFGIIAQVCLGSMRAAKIRPGETIVVFGAGLIGQFVARFAKIAGALNVIVADVSDYKLSKVPEDDCYIKLNSGNMSKEEIQDFIKKYNNGKLADIVFETTSSPKLIENEVYYVEKNGKLIITSSPKGKSVIDFDYCNRMGLTIIGAHNWAVHTSTATNFDRWTRFEDTKYYLELLAKNQLSVENMISHRANYSEAVDIYKMLMADRSKALGVNFYWNDGQKCL